MDNYNSLISKERSPPSPLLLPRLANAVEKVTLVLEGIGEGKVRVNSASLDHLFVILAGGALEIVGIAKKIMMGRVGRSAYWLDHDPSGLVEAGYGPTTK